MFATQVILGSQLLFDDDDDIKTVVQPAFIIYIWQEIVTFLFRCDSCYPGLCYLKFRLLQYAIWGYSISPFRMKPI